MLQLINHNTKYSQVKDTTRFIFYMKLLNIISFDIFMMGLVALGLPSIVVFSEIILFSRVNG